MLRGKMKFVAILLALLLIAGQGGCASSGGGVSLVEIQQQRIEELERELNAAMASARSAEAEAAQAAQEREALRRQAAELEAHLSRVERASLAPGSLLEPILFDFGSAELRDEDEQLLSDFAASLRGRPEVRVGLVGRADPRGSEIYNLELSARRAAAVQDYLIASGVEPWRIEVVAVGENSPLVELDDETGNTVNRSVQLVVMPGGEQVDVRSIPPGARVYFFRVGSEWDSVKRLLDDEQAIAPYRVAEGDTNVRTYRGRTWYNVMIIRDGVKRFRCSVPVTRSHPNLIQVTFSGGESDTPCR